MWKRRSVGTVLSRAIRLRCPRCGDAALFSGWFSMPERCPSCEFKFEREPGYFLGSAYINYGVTAILMTMSYVGLHFVAEIDNRSLMAPLLGFCIVFPLVFFRFARSVWLGMDCFFDHSEFDKHEDSE
ncbi:MAG: DUF983 domain-containing protein, partial [Planctomycetota bacterium]|nr:DUF983 domain-containing protein [Planctomycetota bacterium]